MLGSGWHCKMCLNLPSSLVVLPLPRALLLTSAWHVAAELGPKPSASPPAGANPRALLTRCASRSKDALKHMSRHDTALL